jgi:hypothetical protein
MSQPRISGRRRPPVPHDPDIWKLAAILVRKFGPGASTYAGSRAADAIHQRDPVTGLIWYWIKAAIEGLLKPVPDSDERVH